LLIRLVINRAGVIPLRRQPEVCTLHKSTHSKEKKAKLEEPANGAAAPRESENRCKAEAQTIALGGSASLTTAARLMPNKQSPIARMERATPVLPF
jgi:hypothetical protein